MPIQAIVFDIGGILEVVPEGGDPSARYPQMMEAWDTRLNYPARYLGMATGPGE